jgi:Domain of unknown function (DUF6285)
MTQDRPDAAELLDALAEYLYAEVREWAPREHRFQVLVAANLCGILGRELRAGSEPLRDDLVLLFELLGAEPPAGELSDAELREAVRAAEAELARRLRAGGLDGGLGRIASRLAEHVRRKLDVARPGYTE